MVNTYKTWSGKSTVNIEKNDGVIRTRFRRVDHIGKKFIEDVMKWKEEDQMEFERVLKAEDGLWLMEEEI